MRIERINTDARKNHPYKSVESVYISVMYYEYR